MSGRDAKRKRDHDEAVHYYNEPQEEGATVPADADEEPKVAGARVKTPVQPPSADVTRRPRPGSDTPPAAEADREE